MTSERDKIDRPNVSVITVHANIQYVHLSAYFDIVFSSGRRERERGLVATRQ